MENIKDPDDIMAGLREYSKMENAILIIDGDTILHATKDEVIRDYFF